MRFKLSIVAERGQDIEDLTVNFNSPNWREAAVWADTFKKQLGVKGEWLVTYADRDLSPSAGRSNEDIDAEINAQLAARGIKFDV